LRSVRWHHTQMRSPELARAEVNGHSVVYQDAGEGPPLVLLHGFPCDSRCWRLQLADLSDSFRVLAWDAPGAGSSSDPPDPFTITDWAQCLAGFLDVLGIERAQVLGLSWGGILAQEFYRLYPDRVLTLILCDSASRIFRCNLARRLRIAYSPACVEGEFSEVGLPRRWTSTLTNSGKVAQPQSSTRKRIGLRSASFGYDLDEL
jgi:pimeloyl-ACP methyl ester carboxylesterase